MQHVCTWYVLGSYWYVLVRTRKNKKSIAHNSVNRTVDLMHSILRDIPVRYQRVFHGDIYGYYKVYMH